MSCAGGAINIIRIGRLTALSKLDGGVRGIVAGDVVRRLVLRTMSKQLSPAVERATYDMISRGMMLRGLMRVSSAALPLTRMFYGRPFEYLWEMDCGEKHCIQGRSIHEPRCGGPSCPQRNEA